MNELRNDLINERQVIIAKERGKRPMDFKEGEISLEKVLKKMDCPFCEGNEEETPLAVLTLGDPWNVRVFPNKYPVVTLEGSGIKGYHYVVVEGRDHCKSIAEYSSEELKEILQAYKIMVQRCFEDEDIKYIQIFKNYKRQAGASLEHPHSQIIALNVIPNGKAQGEKCLLCEEVEKELEQKVRVIDSEGHFIAYAPYGSAFQYQMRIVSQSHKSSYHLEFEDRDFGELGILLKRLFKSINQAIGDIPMNICYHFSKEKELATHFYIEIIPRLSFQAGFEQGSGVFINTVAPEDAALLLRKFI